MRRAVSNSVIYKIFVLIGVLMMSSCCITGYCPTNTTEQNEIYQTKEYNQKK